MPGAANARKRHRAASPPPIARMTVVDDDIDDFDAAYVPSSLPTTPVRTSDTQSIIAQLDDVTRLATHTRELSEAETMSGATANGDGATSLTKQPRKKPAQTRAPRAKRAKAKKSAARGGGYIDTTNARDIRAMMMIPAASTVSTSTTASAPISWTTVDMPALRTYFDLPPPQSLAVTKSGSDASIAAMLQQREMTASRRVLRSATRPKAEEASGSHSDNETLLPIERAPTLVTQTATVTNGGILAKPTSNSAAIDDSAHLCERADAWLPLCVRYRVRVGPVDCFSASSIGFWRQCQQDCAMIVPTRDSLAFGVFDGHGACGETAARTAAELLTTKAALAMATETDADSVADAIKRAFVETQARLVDIARVEQTALNSAAPVTKTATINPDSQSLTPITRSPVKKPRRDTEVAVASECDYGTTGLIVAFDPGHTSAIIANCGDSRACVWKSSATDSTLTLKFATRDHDPRMDVREFERVAAAGGMLLTLPSQCRIYPANLSLEAARTRCLTLNMSRALGHLVLRDAGVSAEPDVSVIDTGLSVGESLLILAASDGIWDQLDAADVQRVLERRHCLECVASEIMWMAEERWKATGRGDNLTLIIARLNHR